MTILINETGFVPDDFGESGTIMSLADLLAGKADSLNALLGIDLPNDSTADQLKPWFAQIALIRIPFPSFADGRAFSLAKRLRALGFSGRLRASGHILADQARAVARVGFSEIEISDDLANRQPEEHWIGAFDGPSYQSRIHQNTNSESLSS